MKTATYALATAGLLALAACGGSGANNSSKSGNAGAATNTAPPVGDLNTTAPSTLPPVDTGGVNSANTAGNASGANASVANSAATTNVLVNNSTTR
jgi:hypothetical protein